jgi:hypothetical protein
MASDTTGGMSGRFVNFIFGTLLAGLVTTSFTYLTWREQTRLEFAKERLAEATATFDKASKLMSKRVFQSFSALHNLDTDDDTAFARRLEKLEAAVEEWNLAYSDALQDFQFALEIDDDGRARAYREISTGPFKDGLNCAFAFDDGNRPGKADWQSPSWLLAGLHHCFMKARIRQGILNLRQKPAPRSKAVDAASSPDAAASERKEKFAALDRSINDLHTHAEHVRVAGKKAIERLRRGAVTRGFLEFLKPW